MKKRLFASLLCLALCLGLLPGTARANGDGVVEYIERGWDGSAVTEQPKTIDTYTTITSDTIRWNNGWYVAQGEVTIGTDDNPQRVIVTGDVHLILTDGCTLTVNGGIQVAAGNSLTIYGQSDGADTMGKLTASITSENTDLYNAAIGGNAGETGGTLTVYGGAVEATVTVIDVFQSDPDMSQGNNNGSFAGDSYGAAIGGGGSETGNGGDGGTITIFGGTVRAESSCGAGIGGGSGDIGVGGIGGTITISGGTVRAESTIGAGIGGGCGDRDGGDGGKVTISGGAVRAESYYGGGIGGGGDLSSGDTGGDGGEITISGGTVEVQSVSGAGIGGGSSGLDFSSGFPRKGTGGSGGNITISGGSVTATTMTGRTIGQLVEMSAGRWAGAAIGGGSCGGGRGGSSGTITISGGTVTAIVSSQTAPYADPDAPPKYSAGIGNGAGTGDSVVGSSNITISGGTVFAQSPDGAGIGDGQNNDGDTIDIAISGGTVEAVSTNGAGIGGGMIEALSAIVNLETTYSGGKITISGGSVSAQSTNGAGIGSGAVIYDVEDGGTVSERDTPEVNGGEITVSGGTVSAQSVRGAGIGGGSGQVTIGSNVKVASGQTSPSLTPHSSDGGTVTISGGTVEAVSTKGVGIGSGGMPFYQSESHDVDQYIHCVSGKAGTFATGTDGNAMLFATGRIAHIEDDDTSAWQGVIFLDGKGQLYGTSVTLSEDVTIPSGNTLEIGQGQTLSVGRGVTMTIDNEDCLTGGGTLGAGGSYEILNPLPVFTPTTLFYTGSDLSGRLSLTAPAGSVSIMGQTFTVSGTPTYRDWVITLPAGGILQVGTYTVTAYSPSQGRTVSGQITVIGDSSSTPTYSVILPGRVEGGTVTAKKSYAEGGETFRFTVTPDEGWELDTLSVTDNRGTELDVKYEGDSMYSFKMPARRVEIQVSFREIPPESLPFTDIADNAWYADAVHYVYKHGLMAGISATTFAPDATTSRSMIATILWRMAGSPVVNYAMDYTDVAQGQWYSEAIRWAASEGIVGGYGNGLFGTNDPITREQFAAMLYRFAQEQGYDVSIGENTNILSYTDVADLSEYAISAMQWAVGAGIINGTGDGSALSPQGQATRAQAAVMLTRFCEEYVTW